MKILPETLIICQIIVTSYFLQLSVQVYIVNIVHCKLNKILTSSSFNTEFVYETYRILKIINQLIDVGMILILFALGEHLCLC